MSSTHLRRWAAGVGLALGVVWLGACTPQSDLATNVGDPAFGGFPSGSSIDRQVEFELFELCKDYSGQSGPDVVFDVTVDRDNDNTGADESFQVTLADGECRDIWTDGGPTQDRVTVTEQVPVPASGSYSPSYVKTTLVRSGGTDTEVTDPSVDGNSVSEAFSGDTPSGVVGVLVVFTNTFVPPPPRGDEGCTPGFWKTHTGLGPQANEWVTYGQGDSYDATFGVTSSFGGTLLQALERGGGGEAALGRHAVAALLNAASSVNYFYSAAEVIQIVQDAYAVGTKTAFTAAKDQLEAQNGDATFCPLPANGPID